MINEWLQNTIFRLIFLIYSCLTCISPVIYKCTANGQFFCYCKTSLYILFTNTQKSCIFLSLWITIHQKKILQSLLKVYFSLYLNCFSYSVYPNGLLGLYKHWGKHCLKVVLSQLHSYKSLQFFFPLQYKCLSLPLFILNYITSLSM